MRCARSTVQSASFACDQSGVDCIVFFDLRTWLLSHVHFGLLICAAKSVMSLWTRLTVRDSQLLVVLAYKYARFTFCIQHGVTALERHSLCNGFVSSDVERSSARRCAHESVRHNNARSANISIRFNRSSSICAGTNRVTRRSAQTARGRTQPPRACRSEYDVRRHDITRKASISDRMHARKHQPSASVRSHASHE